MAYNAEHPYELDRQIPLGVWARTSDTSVYKISG